MPSIVGYAESRGDEIWANRLMFGSNDFITHKPVLSSEASTRKQNWWLLGKVR